MTSPIPGRLDERLLEGSVHLRRHLRGEAVFLNHAAEPVIRHSRCKTFTHHNERGRVQGWFGLAGCGHATHNGQNNDR